MTNNEDPRAELEAFLGRCSEAIAAHDQVRSVFLDLVQRGEVAPGEPVPAELGEAFAELDRKRRVV